MSTEKSIAEAIFAENWIVVDSTFYILRVVVEPTATAIEPTHAKIIPVVVS